MSDLEEKLVESEAAPRCSICGGPQEKWHPKSKGYGHNAEPINDGRCCNRCNNTIVIPRRMKDMGY